MDTNFILALAQAAVGQAEPEPEADMQAEERVTRLKLSLSREVVCHQDKKIGIGGVSWQASLALSHSLDDTRLFPTWSQLRVLELGCGTALCGITAWRLGAKTVLLTDVTNCERLVQSSVTATREAAAESPPSGTVAYSKLRWGDPVPEEIAGQFDVILGSDLTYNVEDYAPLLSTLVGVCRPSRSCTRVVLGHQSRPVSDALPTFISRAQEFGFSLSQEPTVLPAPGRECCGGHDVCTIAEPVMGFTMVLQD